MTDAETGEYGDDLARLAARELLASRLSGRQFDSLAPALRPRSLDDGYRVQRVAMDEMSRSGFGRQGGWKIGCTTSVMQQYLHVDAPVSGAMFRQTMWHGQHRFLVSPPRVLGVECEIAVRLGRDLPAREQPYSTDDVADAVDASMAAIEIVEDRYVDYQSLDTSTLVADDFFHYGCVLGAENEAQDPYQLGDVTADMRINGAVVGEGRGTDILGHPLVALAWLANNCASLGTPVLAGDIALLGSVVQTQWVAPGDVVEVRNDMLGNVAATFEVPV
ncbi:MAG TPA: fumarylacetoacetate hydrolase family protein [Acidimicrobiales bacterium]